MRSDQNKTVCDYNDFRRPRYLHGMLLDDKDFLAEQAYHSGKRRLLNRTLHGSGVVCGLELHAKAGCKAIELTPGLALDSCGNEIWVRERVAIDLAKLVPPNPAPTDQKDCVESATDSNTLIIYHLGIRYEEKGTDPASVYLPGADCEERTCEYSRYKEGFCIEIVPCCPPKTEPGLIKSFCDCSKDCKPADDKSGGSDKAKVPGCWECETLKDPTKICRCSVLEEFCEQSVPCPECDCSCCHSNHVILGRIEVDQKGNILKVCINDCRQYVVTWPMIRHLIVRMFAGMNKDIFKLTSDGAELTLPEIESLTANPIKALCWYLRYFVIGEGKTEVIGCKDMFDKPAATTTRPKPPLDEIKAVALQVNKYQESLEQRIKELTERIGYLESPAAKKKQTEK